MTTDTSNLIHLYNRLSKHSNYQKLAPTIQALIPAGALVTRTRYEDERWDFIRKHVVFHQKSVLDIGGNTGYFSFRAIDSGARHATLVEGNATHADFVQLAARTAGGYDGLDVSNQYFNIAENGLPHPADVTFLLNVLHHAGDDYDSCATGADVALGRIRAAFRKMAGLTPTIVFQLGFNWKGDVRFPLFLNGTKMEMTHFVREVLEDQWNIDAIGVPQRTIAGKLEYLAMDDTNCRRDDSLGEFLNRPLYIIRAV